MFLSWWTHKLRAATLEDAIWRKNVFLFHLNDCIVCIRHVKSARLSAGSCMRSPTALRSWQNRGTGWNRFRISWRLMKYKRRFFLTVFFLSKIVGYAVKCIFSLLNCSEICLLYMVYNRFRRQRIFYTVFLHRLRKKKLICIYRITKGAIHQATGLSKHGHVNHYLSLCYHLIYTWFECHL